MLRYWPLVGCVVFGLLLMLGVNFAFARPDDFSASPNLVAFYESDRHAIEVALGSVAVVIAALLLLVLTTRLTRALETEGGRDALQLARSLATATAVLLAAGGAVWSVTVWNRLFYDPLTAETSKLLLMLGWMLAAFAGMFAAAAMVASTTVAMRTVEAAPRWLERLGYLLAIVLLLSPMLPPMLALPIWLLVALYRLRDLAAPP